MSRSMIKQQNSGATAHVVLYTPRQSTNLMFVLRVARQVISVITANTKTVNAIIVES